MSFPVVATKPMVTITLLAGYFTEQFRVNFQDSPKRWWQVFDRTTGREVPKTRWSVNEKRGTVTITGARPAFQIHREFPLVPHLGGDLDV
jgi:beta-D-galactosyl-(1->4)-L-rhamnose phosphorylase